MNVLFFWEKGRGLSLDQRCNPYAGLLSRALAKRGVQLEPGDYNFQRSWLERQRSDHQVLHLNWLRMFYQKSTLEETLAQLEHFSENLSYAKQLGYRIVWTMHNFLPHERRFPQADRLANLGVCRIAHAVVSHCRHGADLLRKFYHRVDGIHVVPHGNFMDVYPNITSRQEARKKLALPEDLFVYLFFGNLRTYKGVENLIEAFNELNKKDACLQLMIKRHADLEYLKRIMKLAEGNGKIIVAISDHFPNDVFQYYLNAADVAVFPFSRVLTSGSVIAALSFGTPVIAPRLGCLPELIDESVGILYDPKDDQALNRGLVEIRQRDLDHMGRSARALAKSLDWDKIAARVEEIYRK